MNSRRTFLQSGAVLGAAFFSVPGALAQQLTRTPAQTEGPFYPIKLPLDTANDLIVVNDALTPAVGTIAHVSGRILDLETIDRRQERRQDFARVRLGENAARGLSRRSDRDAKDKSQDLGRGLQVHVGFPL